MLRLVSVFACFCAMAAQSRIPGTAVTLPPPPVFRMAKPAALPPTAHDLALQRVVGSYLPFGTAGSSKAVAAPQAADRRRSHASASSDRPIGERQAPQWRHTPAVQTPSQYAQTPRYADVHADDAQPVRRSAVEAVANEGATPSLERTHERAGPVLPSVGPGGDAFTELRIPAALVNGMNPNLRPYVPGAAHSQALTKHRRRMMSGMQNFRSNMGAVSSGFL